MYVTLLNSNLNEFIFYKNQILKDYAIYLLEKLFTFCKMLYFDTKFIQFPCIYIELHEMLKTPLQNENSAIKI